MLFSKSPYFLFTLITILSRPALGVSEIEGLEQSRCPIAFAKLTDQELEKLSPTIRRFQVELKPASELQNDFLQLETSPEKRNPNLLWNTASNPVGIRRESSNPTDLPMELTPEEGARYSKLFEGANKKIRGNRDENKIWSQLVQSLVIAEEKLANETRNEAIKLERQIKKTPAGPEADRLKVEARRLERRATNLYWDAFSKFGDITQGPVELRKRMSRGEWNDLAASASRHLESGLRGEGIWFHSARVGDGPGSGYYKATIIDPSPDHALGRLAAGLGSSAGAEIGFSMRPFHLYDSDRRIVGQTDERNPVQVLRPIDIWFAPSSVDRESQAKLFKKVNEPAENRSPLELTFRRIRTDPKTGISSYIGNEASANGTLAIPHFIEQFAADLPSEMPESLGAHSVRKVLLEAARLEPTLLAFAKESRETLKSIEDVLSKMSQSHSKDPLSVVLKQKIGGFSKGDPFHYDVWIFKGQNPLGALKIYPEPSDKPEIKFFSQGSSLQMPMKGGDLEMILSKMMPLLKQKSGKTERLADEQTADLTWHLLNTMKRNAEVSTLMVLPLLQQFGAIKEAAHEYEKAPSEETYQHFRQMFHDLPDISGRRLTTQYSHQPGGLKSPANGPFNSQFDEIDPSPFLATKMKEALSDSERSETVGRIGVYALTRWAHQNDYIAMDRSLDKIGYDVLLTNRKTGQSFQVEVKARSAKASAKTVSLSWRELQSAHENPETAAIAIVMVSDDGNPSIALRRFEVPHPPDPRVEKSELNIDRLLHLSSSFP